MARRRSTGRPLSGPRPTGPVFPFVAAVCGGASSCPAFSDEAGVASTQVTPTLTGASTITATLAPASYTPPQSKLATVVGTESTLELAAIAPTKWIGQGA